MDVVIADSGAVLDPHGLQRYTEALGARLLLAPVAAVSATARHDPGKLGTVMAAVLGLPAGDQVGIDRPGEAGPDDQVGTVRPSEAGPDDQVGIDRPGEAGPGDQMGIDRPDAGPDGEQHRDAAPRRGTGQGVR